MCAIHYLHAFSLPFGSNRPVNTLFDLDLIAVESTVTGSVEWHPPLRAQLPGNRIEADSQLL